MTAWETWAAGVLSGIGAPVDAANVDTVWAWSNAETAPYDLMRWNNPMNTTEPWPGARDSGAQPGAHDVKIYATLQDGIDATVYTLTQEPYYGAIVANLRASLPRQQWGAYSTAGAELHSWGTGTNWLQSTYGAAPNDLIQKQAGGSELNVNVQPPFTVDTGTDTHWYGTPGGQDMGLMGARRVVVETVSPDGAWFQFPGSTWWFSASKSSLLLPAAGVDLAPVLAAIAELKASYPTQVVATLSVGQQNSLQAILDAVTRVENALKAA